jgi:uncharacterized protein
MIYLRPSHKLALFVKLSQTLDAKAFKGLKELEEDLGKNFHKGIVLYGGTQVVAFGKNLLAVPLHKLWS